jgi:hypothetical protein
MGQRGRGRRLTETVAPQGLRSVATSVGSGADIGMDRAQQEDEQRLWAVVCERGGVGVRRHDPPHGEAARSCLRTLHTVSEGVFCEVGLPLYGVLRSSPWIHRRFIASM